MSKYTTLSQLVDKRYDKKGILSQEPTWPHIPLGYQALKIPSTMSGQFPPPSASPPVPFTAHHLPPTAPTPGQYCPPATGVPRLRVPTTWDKLSSGQVPTLGSSPPPPQGHNPPWGHSGQNAGLTSLSGNLGYFGPPHIGGLAGPGRGQPQPWQTGPKPTTHPATGNPLFSLQMLVTQESSSTGGAIPSMRASSDDYQQETMDLSSHSASTTAIEEHPSKKELRNGGITNGEVNAAEEKLKSSDSVSVIAQNPLREPAQESNVLNCSADPKPERVTESLVKNTPGVSESVPEILPQPIKDNWEGSNHTPDNVESILEDMFQTQEEKSSSPGALPLVVPQSVIVTNERSSVVENKLDQKPESPEKINEQKLAEILVEDVDSVKEVKEEKKIPDKVIEEIKEKKEIKEEPAESTKMESLSMESTSSEDVKLVTSESEEKNSQSEGSSQRSTPQDRSKNISEETTGEGKGVEPENAFIKVESELEKMFAGIVEPGSELSDGNTSSQQTPQGNSSKKRGRPKGSLRRRNSDTVFVSTDVTPKKKNKKSELDKKGKKLKGVDSGRDSPLSKKSRSGYIKDGSNDSSTVGGAKSRGPLIHVEGPKETPSTVVVINSGVRTNEEDEGAEKSVKSSFRKYPTYHNQEARPPKGTLYNSTLSSRYDSHTPDATWLCVFCKRGPHCGSGLGGIPAGDLFGPYVISSASQDSSNQSRGVPSDKEIVEEQKRRGGGKHASIRATGGAEQFVQKISRKHKRSVSMDSDMGLSGMLSISDKGEYEIWMHEPCAVWAPGIYLIGSKVVGLQEAVWASIKTSCGKCGEPGANIGCVTRGCPLIFHYGCAVLDGWYLNEETFIAKCRTHTKTTDFFQAGMFKLT